MEICLCRDFIVRDGIAFNKLNSFCMKTKNKTHYSSTPLDKWLQLSDLCLKAYIIYVRIMWQMITRSVTTALVSSLVSSLVSPLSPTLLSLTLLSLFRRKKCPANHKHTHTHTYALQKKTQQKVKTIFAALLSFPSATFREFVKNALSFFPFISYFPKKTKGQNVW